MIKSNIVRLALLTSVATAAFDSNGPGWKMDGDKLALDGSGNPIWINAEGQEGAIKGDTIATLNAEAKTLRTQRDQGQQIIDKYKGSDGKLIDPAAAITALSTVKDIDASKLIAADKLEELRTQMRSEFTAQLGEVTTDRDGWKTRYEDKLIDDVFNDPFMNNIAMPKDFFAAAMRKNFKVEDGKVVAYDSAGNRLNSKKEVGTFAGVSEALELIVNAHPQKDTLLKPDTGTGSGSGGGGGQRGGSRRISRQDFSALDPMKKAEAAEAQSKGELVIYDA